jgi:hypothetical protein
VLWSYKAEILAVNALFRPTWIVAVAWLPTLALRKQIIPRLNSLIGKPSKLSHLPPRAPTGMARSILCRRHNSHQKKIDSALQVSIKAIILRLRL